MELEIKDGYEFKNELKELFTEYTNSLIEEDETFADYLEQQNYDHEVKHLEEKYGRPNGRIFVAFYEGKLAGCIGLKKIDDDICEMKRLYVRPEFRGKHIGNILASRIVEEAKNIGYKSMVLDTLPFLTSAIKMYKKIGFYEIEQYNDSPMQEAVYMKMDLK